MVKKLMTKRTLHVRIVAKVVASYPFVPIVWQTSSDNLTRRTTVSTSLTLSIKKSGVGAAYKADSRDMARPVDLVGSVVSAPRTVLSPTTSTDIRPSTLESFLSRTVLILLRLTLHTSVPGKLSYPPT